jgi:ATP-dependent DNA helicase RecQ
MPGDPGASNVRPVRHARSVTGPAVEPDALLIAANRVLRALAGPTATLRPDQLTAASALVCDRRRVLCVQATGWGKSAVYWIAAAALREAGSGPALVVSPLLALMRDQVAAASKAGLRAVTLNSANVEDWSSIEKQLADDEVDVLLTSPERLASPRFADSVLPALLPRLGLLVIDEAHCVSDWGFDFRPDYQRLTRLLTATRGDLPVLATTATANDRVTRDVAQQLASGAAADPLVLRGTLARSSLQLGVVPGLSALQRYAWVAGALDQLAGSGIVYVPTVADAHRLAGFLTERGHSVAAYSGQLETAEREDIENRLRRNDVKAVVSTSALGMGYDKPDLAFCVHVGSPSSPVAYYQQVGRAGRALDTAVAVLLPAETDDRLWAYFADASTPDPALAARALSALAEFSDPLSLPKLEEATGARRGRLEALLKILAVGGAVRRVGVGWQGTGVPWVFDKDRYAAIAATRAAEADIMRRYAAGAGCLMSFLRLALDDPHAGEPCGVCSVCVGALPGGLSGQPTKSDVDSARVFARGRDVVIEPRKLWPSGSRRAEPSGSQRAEPSGSQRAEPTGGGRKGRISKALGEGRALAFADDPGWAEQVIRLTSDGAADGELPEEVAAGVVELLARWARQWPARPVAAAPIPSRGHPRLVTSLARHIADVGRLDLLQPFELTGPRPVSGVASAQRVAAVTSSLRLTAGATVPAGPILLVDDVYASGWTMTVAAALLADAGADAIYPLVLHRRP